MIKHAKYYFSMPECIRTLLSFGKKNLYISITRSTYFAILFMSMETLPTFLHRIIWESSTEYILHDYTSDD